MKVRTGGIAIRYSLDMSTSKRGRERAKFVYANPFVGHDDWHNNACIENYLWFGELAEHFEYSADALSRCAVRGSGALDRHIYAVCFLYRHSLELSLKSLWWKSHYVVTNRKKLPPFQHSLRSLWAEVEQYARRILQSDFPLSHKESAAVKRFLADIEEHDPESASFRYPIDKTVSRTHPNLKHVNVRALRQAIKGIGEYLGRIFYLIDYHYQQCVDQSDQ